MTTNKKNLILIIFSALLLSMSLKVQTQNIKNPTTQTYKVLGNCGMCEKTIEKAATKKASLKSTGM